MAKFKKKFQTDELDWGWNWSENYDLPSKTTPQTKKTLIAKVEESPKIILPADIFKYVDTVIKRCKTEVMLIGTVEILEEGYRIDQVYMPDQVCTASETTLTEEAVISLTEQLANEDLLGRAKCWIHSHASMEVFWSGTDEQNIKTLLQEDYLVSIVGNHAGEYLCRVDWKMPRFKMDGLPLEIEEIEDEDLVKKVEQDLKTHVRQPEPKVKVIYKGSKNNWKSDHKKKDPKPTFLSFGKREKL